MAAWNLPENSRLFEKKGSKQVGEEDTTQSKCIKDKSPQPPNTALSEKRSNTNAH